MFRTRDYALMLATITFLVVGIVTTIFSKGGLPGLGGMSATVFESTKEPDSYEVIVAENTEPSREERIASLREKIARLGIADEETVPESEETPSPLEEVTEEEAQDISEQKCSYYGAYTTSWNPRGLIIEEAEGARLVYREGEVTTSASSTAVVTKDIVVQLPVRSVPMPTEHCIPSDVIGIATDGSLIRNNEVAVYSVFGPNTLVGYALDGFPIYGASSGASDICGGVMVGGQYRYHLHGERETIITCFAGVPVSL